MNKKKEKKSSIFGFLKWVGIIVITIIFALVVIAAMFEKEIGALVIKAINKQLKTEIAVESASLSLIWRFPKASVSLKKVKIDGVGKQKDKLLEVDNLSLQCGIVGLLSGNYKFNAIAINNGKLFIHSDKRGRGNYDVFKSNEEVKEEPADAGDLNLSISNATLTNVLIHYINEASEQDIKVLAKSAYFEGDFMIDNERNEDKHRLLSYAELQSKHITLGEQVYFKNKEIAYDGAVDIDNANGLYSFNKIKLYLEGNEFHVDGSIEQQEEGTLYNMIFDSDYVRLNPLLQLLPEQYLATLGQFDSRAKLNFEARVNGMNTKRKNPIVEVNFGLNDGRITHPSLDGSMKNVNFEVHFTNGNGIDDKTAKLELKNFEAYLNNEPINLVYTMTGLKNPAINMSLDGKIPLAAVYGFGGESVTAGSGVVHVQKIGLEGHLEDMISMYRIPNVKLDGIVNFDQAKLTVNEVESTIETGQLALTNNEFNVTNLILQTPNTHAVLNGKFQNVLPVLLSDSLNSQNAKLTFDASFNSNKMDVDEILTIGGGYTEEEIEEAAEEEKDSLIKETYAAREYRTSFLKGTFITNIKEIKYGDIIAQNFNGEVSFDNSIMKLKGVKVNAMDGLLELNSKIHFEKEPYVEAFLDCQSLDIKQFLEQFDNFGQEVLRADNINGELESLIKINIFFDSLGNFQHDDLFVVADVKLKDGELINVPMINQFAGVIKLRDLKHISFTELSNQFKIEHSKLHMPAMFIQSNAINLLIGGWYGFNHDMDFKIKINAGQVLANKFKKYNPERQPLKAKKKGLFNIYAHIFGNVYEDFKYKIGPKHTKKALKADMNSSLPTLVNTLKAEFYKTAENNKNLSVKALEEPTEWEDIPEYGGGEDEVEYIEGF